MTSHRPVVLITGGAKRLGAAIATDLAAHGFTIALHYHNGVQEADGLVREIRANGAIAQSFQADLLADNAASLIQRVHDELGPVQLLVNNASLFKDDGLGHLDDRIWDEHFAIHVKTPVKLADAMATLLPIDMSGMIVNMIDQRVLRLTPNFLSYTLSKSALWTATRTLAQALAPRIRVNAIGPGPSLKSPRQSDADFAKQTQALLLQYGPALEEFGQTIRYLWQTRSITGQMIALDGGQHLAWQTPDVVGQVE